MAEGKFKLSNDASATQKTLNSSTAKSLNGKISAVFFDLDNTLIPTRAGDSKAIRKLADVLENQFGFTKEESTVATQTFLKSFRRCTDNSQTSLDSWRTYLWREALPLRFKHLAEQIYPKWLQLRYRYLAVPQEYIQLLKRFRECGLLLALITNGPSNAQWEKVHKLHVSPYFDCVLVSSDLPWEKPHPNIFFAACNFLGVKPEQCAMIGDKLETDIKGGCLAKLGVTFWIPLNQTIEPDLTDVTHPPDFILRNVLDLYKYFPITSTTGTSSSSTNCNSSGITHSVSATSAINPTLNNIGSQTNRRSSHISCSVTTSTCESDISRQQQQHHLPFQHHFTKQQQQHHKEREQKSHTNKYRRGGSLPAMDSLNSENENSSDSLFI